MGLPRQGITAAGGCSCAAWPGPGVALKRAKRRVIMTVCDDAPCSAREGSRAATMTGSDMDTSSIVDLLERGEPGASAVGAPDRVPPLRYRDLAALAHRTIER